MKNQRVYAIVLNWNNYPATAQCLQSLNELEYNNMTVVLVDNGSTDGSFDRLSAHYDPDIAIRNERNVGFAGGMNSGIRHAVQQLNGSGYIWLLNNDVVVNRKTLDSLVNTIQDRPSIGIISPRIRKDNGVYFEKGYVDWNTGNSGHEKAGETDGGLVRNDYIPFCAPLIRSEIFNEVGYIPEDYFLYFEDVDFCTRVNQAGYQLVTKLGTNIYHESGGSTDGAMSPIPSYYTVRNRWLLFHQRYSERVGPLFPLNHHLRTLGRIVIQGTNGDIEAIKATIQGWKDGLQGLSGRGPYP